MRSISNFPTGANRRRGKKPTTEQSRGRSVAAIVDASSSPSNSNYGSSDGENYGSSSSSNRSTSRSPVAKSPSLGRSVRVTKSVTRSPHFQKNQQQQQQHAAPRNRSRSWSPSSSPISIDDNRDEVTTQSYHQQQQLLAPQALSSSPRPHFIRQAPSNDLCTIAEDRRISSNTLSQMAVTSTAQQIAKSPVLARRRLRSTQQAPRQQPPGRKFNYSSQEFLDPYNDDDYTDYEDQDCGNCWAYRKSASRNWWPFQNASDAIPNVPRKNDIVGFPTKHPRMRTRRTSF